MPRFRTNFGGNNTGGRFEIPSTFTLAQILPDEYFVRPIQIAAGLYVKDVTYGDRSIFYESFRPGSAIGSAGLRIVIGQDGGNIGVQVADRKGVAVPAVQVLIMPADALSEIDMAARLTTGDADQAGTFASQTLPPGKYFVAATSGSFDHSEQSIQKLWESKLRFTEVTVAPVAKAQVKLEPLDF